MNNNYLEVGKILNTHGVRGEMKVQSWCDDPEDLCQLETVYIGTTPYRVKNARLHGVHVLLTLEGVGSIDDAMLLKNKVLLASRDDFELEEGAHFVVDLIGLTAVNAITGEEMGKVTDIMEYPAQDIYVIQGEKNYMIPDVPEFVQEIDMEHGVIRFTPLEGMAQ